EDLTQEAFVRAWQKLDKFRGDAAFGTWLHRLTVNLVLSHCRGHGKRWKALEMTDDVAKYEGAGFKPAGGGGTDPSPLGKAPSVVSGRLAGEGGVDGLRGSVPTAGPPCNWAMHPGTRMDLEQAIGTLPEGARQVFVLHDVEGYKHHEIAEMAGIAVGTAKAQLHRARKLLREVLT
ncbi:MAG: RNA polymerase sigma factor, partial [Candidatus Hydrogenedentales bacterium]